MEKVRMVKVKMVKGSMERATTSLVANLEKEEEVRFTRWQRQENSNSYCWKFGRWRRDCHKLKVYLKHKRVRQIEGVVDESGQGSNAAPNSGTAPSNVRLVSFAPVAEENSLGQDYSCETLHCIIQTVHSLQTPMSAF